MKYATLAARFLLAAIFIVFSLNFWLHFLNLPGPAADSPAGTFMGVLFTTGYLAAVKVLELLGGIFVASGRLLGAGLLILGPIILNILAFHMFVARDIAKQPMVIGIAALALFLLWTKREKFFAFATA